MADKVEIENVQKSEEERSDTSTLAWRMERWLLWFIGGGALSFFALCSAVLFVMVIFSVTLNGYLAWQMSGFEVVISRPMPTAAQLEAETVSGTAVAAATLTPDLQPTDTVQAVLATPTNTSESTPAPPTSTPTPIVKVVTASPTPTITKIETDFSGSDSGNESGTSSVADTTTSTADESGTSTAGADTQRATRTSTNEYKLIPLEDGRDSRPAEEHGDLNLRLRDPQPSNEKAELIDYTGFDDSNAPKLSARFKPDFVQVYTVHDWDWGCNCKGKLKNDGFLVGIKTTPGEPIYIPTKEQDIWGDKYYAVLLYASEDSLTFVYSREGTVAHAYSVHYLGLDVDPNLLALYRESTGNELPGLTLDTPVGIATEELIVSIRDKGTFMDTRSRKDWWD